MRVMLDNNILSLSKFLKPRSVSSPNTLNRIALLKSPKRDPNPERALEIEWLPTIAELSKEGKIELCIYNYIHMESMKRPQSYPSAQTGDLLLGCKKFYLPNLFSSKFIGISELRFLNDFLIDFVKILRSSKGRDAILAVNRNSLSEKFITHDLDDLINILNLICHNMSEKHFPDAFHYWASVLYGCDAFLTVDGKLHNILAKNKKIEGLSCKPLLPSRLARMCGVENPVFFPYSYDTLYYYSGLPYD